MVLYVESKGRAKKTPAKPARKAVQGAADTINNHAPRLAISVYHKNSDLYEIPLLVHRIFPKYKLYLRHLGHFFDDTVLFATT